jgi:hypothetical protein
MQIHEFKPFEKIARLNREIVITEKIDGTNALVFVSDDGEVLAGSRSRWITLEDDNAGFAKWVKAHEEELRTGLGPGYHYGEWWGSGIGRKYGLKEKRFSLFNVSRWTDDVRPSCCGIVPKLYRGPFSTEDVASVVATLAANGSVAVPGFMDPEGVVIYHGASGQLFKVTINGDASPKGKAS